MAGPTLTPSRLVLVAAAAVLAASCTLHKQEAPALTGPSELSTSLAIAVSPDVLYLDGASQSLVTITARDANGQPSRNLTLRAQIFFNGAPTDFGSLSARNLVTDSSGRATLVYTAPAASSAVNVDTGATVQIAVTPQETNFDNANTRFASIRLIPTGVIVPPDGLKPNFTVSPASPTQGDSVFFQACTDPATPCAPANNPITSYSWNFGDGATASGNTATHTYTQAGNFVVTLTITDPYGRSASAQRQVAVGGGAAPTAQFVSSPTSPNVNQTVNFNATLSTAPPGHTITDYSWNFGDGTAGSGSVVSHVYTTAGSYVVVLKITDDAGVKATSTQTITVGSGAPTADFVFSPSTPTAGSLVSFNASTSRAAPGRSIVTYSWSFGDATTGSGASPTHTYSTPGTYSVILTVVDDQGNSGTLTKTVTVS